jgi:cytochrome c oxidase cbb3-type subunit 3
MINTIKSVKSTGRNENIPANDKPEISKNLWILFLLPSNYVNNLSIPLLNVFGTMDLLMLVVMNILLLLVNIWLFRMYVDLLSFTGKIEAKPGLFGILSGNIDWGRVFTKSVPVEKEASIQFEHEYDGIRELDNTLPPWWLWMFYATIIFSVVYMIHYHVTPIKAFENIGFIGPGVGQEELYRIEMEEAEKQKQEYLEKAAANINENNVELLTDATDLEKGKEIFKTNCAVCHGQNAQGGAGPNLTDDYWIHGGGIKNVFKTIKYGVPEKGMIPWETQLSPKQIQLVASYVLSLRGSNPPGALPPQGELWLDDSLPANNVDSLKQDTVLKQNNQNS